MQEIKKLVTKKTLNNGVWLFLLQIFNTVIPLLTLPYVTRILGKEMYGYFSTALNIITYLQVLVEFGFGMSATRKVAIRDKSEINKIFSAVLLARALFLGLSIIIGAIYLFLNRSNYEVTSSFIALMICLVGYCMQLNWLFQGMQDMRYISIVNIVARTASVALIFLFVKSRNDLFLYSILYSVSPFLSGVIGLFLAKRKYNIKVVHLTWKELTQEIKDGFYVFTTQMSSKVFGSIGVTFLAMFSTASDVGVFSAIQKITHILMLCWSPISQILYPISSQKMQSGFNDGKNYVYSIRKYVLPVFVALGLIIGIAARPLVLVLYGEEYVDYYYWLYPLIGWLIFSINNNFLGIQILLASGNDEKYSKCFQISLACTVALNFIMIYFFKGVGASIAPMISEIILFVLLSNSISNISKRTN